MKLVRLGPGAVLVAGILVMPGVVAAQSQAAPQPGISIQQTNAPPPDVQQQPGAQQTGQQQQQPYGAQQYGQQQYGGQPSGQQPGQAQPGQQQGQAQRGIVDQPSGAAAEAITGQRSGRVASDASTATDVIERLGAARLDGRDVRVTVNDGMVMLRGTVPSEDARRQVLQLVSQTRHVRGVSDQLTVLQPQPSAPSTQPQSPSQSPGAVPENSPVPPNE